MIGVKEFRGNIAKYATQARTKNQRFIILKNNEPIFDVRPLSKKDNDLDKLLIDLRKAEKSVSSGKYFTQAQMEKKYGIK
jgi:hypothetical protein